LIYICIPTHNEQQTVGVVLWKLRQVLTEFPRDYQLLVADDASTDKTIEVLEPYTRVLPLTVISSEQRQGHAASLEMLLREAVRRSEYPKRDVVVTLQADFSEEPDDVVALIKRMEAGADVAVGIKVSSAREPRMRRLARSLSSFFTRREKWPEGVITPFDGYRAYRLHAVKRAIEECNGGRLLHYDGWAGHAELLRAVLPHARRVDSLNVEDRPDRLQRPRRERPMAAAWQVRAMAAGQQPAGLVPVEELDRIAATASRSRDRSQLNGSAQARGGASRDRRPSGGDSRSRATRAAPARNERGRPERGRGERGRGEGAPESSGSGEAPKRRERRPAAPDQAAGEAAPRGRGRRGGQAAGEADATDMTAVVTPAEGVQPAEDATPQEGTAPKKRRRRRRGKGGSAATAAAATGTDAQGAEGPDADAGLDADPAAAERKTAERTNADRTTADATPAMTDATQTAGAADEGGDGDDGDAAERPERKRRRRGGRGRRRKRPAGEVDTGDEVAPDDAADRAGGNGGSGVATDEGAPAQAGAGNGGGNDEQGEPAERRPAEGE
jgi:hypothetical protein